MKLCVASDNDLSLLVEAQLEVLYLFDYALLDSWHHVSDGVSLGCLALVVIVKRQRACLVTQFTQLVAIRLNLVDQCVVPRGQSSPPKEHLLRFYKVTPIEDYE